MRVGKPGQEETRGKKKLAYFIEVFATLYLRFIYFEHLYIKQCLQVMKIEWIRYVKFCQRMLILPMNFTIILPFKCTCFTGGAKRNRNENQLYSMDGVSGTPFGHNPIT